ncbi:transcriptional regulator [Phytohabitans houttuyneae]|uniref:Transcriptional regulator n=1 Tax=Phytohabitans houttuyneae TaxID=1076126 RepID=A0A6V8K522_9ACTN|nr:transcriptional regulator [Phytohabitans houttuyneae]GFJ77491.1 hypothetical protein Phou_016710 [Phytohabitans houttuyneae]
METFGDAVRRLSGSESLRSVARRAHLDAAHLSRIVRGIRPPTHLYASALDEAFGTDELVAMIGGSSVGEWTIDGEAWRRRDSEGLAAMLLAETPSAGNALRLAHEWLIADPPQVYEVRAGRRIGQSTVERVIERVQQLRLLDDHLGGTGTYQVVTAELVATAGLLRDASYTEAIGQRLLVAIAELCQLAGWVASDAGQHADAQRLYLTGVRAAHAGGDAPGAANNLSSLSYQVANIGDPRDAVILARSAVRGAGRAATATTRALLLDRLSWAHARAREAGQAERSLDAADGAYSDRKAADDPPWTYWLSLEEVEIMAGRVWTELRRPLRAVPILERATAGYDDSAARETSLYLTWLAESLLQAGEIERSAETASRALGLSLRAGSVRADGRVQTLRRLLGEYRGTPAADDFEEEYRVAMESNDEGPE